MTREYFFFFFVFYKIVIKSHYLLKCLHISLNTYFSKIITVTLSAVVIYVYLYVYTYLVLIYQLKTEYLYFYSKYYWNLELLIVFDYC